VADFGSAYRLWGGSRSDPHCVRTRLPVYAEIDTLYGSPEADAGTAIADAPRDPQEARRDGGIPGELPPTNLPEAISELVGRDDVLGEILSLAAAHRLVTLTGAAGGIGKTRLALAAARRLLP
jgi:hypothetical protein